MPKINVYVPDDLAEEIKNHEDVPVSRTCQEALWREIHPTGPAEGPAEGRALVELCKRAMHDGIPAETVVTVLMAWSRMRAALETGRRFRV